MKTLEVNYTGRKAQTGKICFDDRGRMHIFVTYCDTCNGKVIMTTDEARAFTRKYTVERKKMIDKLLLSMVKKRKL